MQYSNPIACLAALLLCAGAAAAEGPPDPMHAASFDKAQMQKHHARMCSDILAGASGEMAFLEVKLALSGSQKPLFERWKAVRLDAARKHAADCAATMPPDKEPSLLDNAKQEEKMLRTRLDDLHAEMPALEALAGALSDEQKGVLAHGAMMGPPPGGFRGMPHKGGCGAPPPDGGHGAPPPDGEHGAPPPR
jgi:hypothetical protein